MKLLIFFFVAAVWLQLPAEGEAGKRNRLLSRVMKKRESVFSNEESNESGNDESAEPVFTASDVVKKEVHKIFTHSFWRELLMKISPEEMMANPEFRAKWEITAKDDIIHAMATGESLSDEDREMITKFLSSRNWKSLIALSSSKAELTNKEYRDAWKLGELSDNVKDSDEDGNFFQGPQWNEFLQHTELEVDEDASDWQKTAILMDKISDIGSMMQSIESD